jgi:hypothetical protein
MTTTERQILKSERITQRVSDGVRDYAPLVFDKQVIRTVDLRVGDDFAAPGFGGMWVGVCSVCHLTDGRTVIGYDVIYGARRCRKEVVRKTTGTTTIYVKVEAAA